MENVTVILTLRRDTLELDIDAPEVSLDVALSIIDRAKRALENQEKIVIATQLREAANATERTGRIISKLKM